MDPITTAIIAGAAAALKDDAKDAVQSAYQALKKTVSGWFAGQPQAEAALKGVESTPIDTEAQKALAEAVRQRTAEQPADENLQQAAKRMKDAIHKDGSAEDKERYATVIDVFVAEVANFTGGAKVAKDLDANERIKLAKVKTANFGAPHPKKVRRRQT